MKFYTRFLFLLLPVILISCSKIETTPQDHMENIRTSLEEGHWKITYFYINNRDTTTTFLEMGITFESDGDLVIYDEEASVINGKWLIHDDGLGEQAQHVYFNLEINSEEPDELDVLNEKWEIIEYSNIRIKLERHLGSSGMEILIFEKVT